MRNLEILVYMLRTCSPILCGMWDLWLYVTQVTTVTWMGADYDSYINVGPNQKGRGLRLSGSSSSRIRFLRLRFLFQECAIGRCTWAHAWGTRSVSGPAMGAISLRSYSGWTTIKDGRRLLHQTTDSIVGRPCPCATCNSPLEVLFGKST